MFGLIASSAVAGMEMALDEQRRFNATLDGLPEGERQRRIERRQDRLRADRQHREMVEALERRSDGLSMAKIIFGAALFGSMVD